MTFVAGYWWRIKPGFERQFRKAWKQGSVLIRERYGSLGSRLHRDQHGRFVGIAEWPDKATWQRAFDAKMDYGNADVRAAFLESLEDWADEPFLLMEVTDDVLERSVNPSSHQPGD